MEEKISSLENLVDLKESQLAVLPQVKTKTQKYETQKKKIPSEMGVAPLHNPFDP